MRKPYFVVLVFLLGIIGNAFAIPSVFVTNPADIRFVELQDLSKFLEEDLQMQKGITKLVGSKVIDHKFRKAGIPDPAEKGLKYCIVVREDAVDNLQISFIFKGDIDAQKFYRFADKRYLKYFEDLSEMSLEAKSRKIENKKISGINSRVYSYAFRNSQAVITHFNDYTMISTVPANDYSLINDIVKVLVGRARVSNVQPKVIRYMATFVPTREERREIEFFQNKDKNLVEKVKKGFKKVTDKKAYLNDQKMEKVEQMLKSALARIVKMSYQVEAVKRADGYAYDINMIFKCNNEKEARYLEELAMAWLAYTASKTKTSQDMLAFQANKIRSSRDSCVFSVKLGSSKEEQYQFSSLMMTLMMQDRRFRRVFR